MGVFVLGLGCEVSRERAACFCRLLQCQVGSAQKKVRGQVMRLEPHDRAKLRHRFLIVSRQMQGQSQIHVGSRIVWEGPRQIPVNRDSLLEILCLHQLLPALRFGRKPVALCLQGRHRQHDANRQP